MAEIGKILMMTCSEKMVVVLDHNQKLYKLYLHSVDAKWKPLSKEIDGEEEKTETAHIGQC
jgi:hypothetical protein